MQFDQTITLGNLLTVFSILITFIGASVSLYVRLEGLQSGLKNINSRIDDVDRELQKQTDILIELAQTRARLNAMDKRMDEIVDRFISK